MTDHVHFLPHTTYFGDILYPPGSTYGPRLQQKLQFVSVYSGHITVHVDEHVFSWGENTIFVLFPGSVEYFEFAKHTPTHHGWVDFFVDVIPEDIFALLQEVQPGLPLTPEMAELIRQGVKIQASSLRTGPILLKLLAAQVLWRYLGEGRRLLKSQAKGNGHPIIWRAREYIELHLTEPLTLACIAEAVSVSPGHLIRLFKDTLGQTPMDYVWDSRVSAGIELLKHSGLSVSTIADRCGFKSSNHFSRRVRRATGCSPLKLRRRAWDGRGSEADSPR